MRQDLTQYGVEETRTPEAVDAAIAPGSGSVLLVVNSVCGCAAGSARPAVGLALAHAVRPDKAITVFAGGDVAAVERVRTHHLAQFDPSSPSIALFQDGKPIFYLHRTEIERRMPEQIAATLIAAFDKHCAAAK